MIINQILDPVRKPHQKKKKGSKPVSKAVNRSSNFHSDAATAFHHRSSLDGKSAESKEIVNLNFGHDHLQRSEKKPLLSKKDSLYSSENMTAVKNEKTSTHHGSQSSEFTLAKKERYVRKLANNIAEKAGIVFPSTCEPASGNYMNIV